MYKCVGVIDIQDLDKIPKNNVSARNIVKRWQRQRAVVRAFTTEQESRACLFTKKEEQRYEQTLIFEKNQSKRYKACSDVVGVTGLEPAASRPPDVCATSCATPR